MAVAAQSIIKTVSVDRLQDAGAKRWPIAELCRSFNLGQKLISLVRPDLSSKRATITCVAGTLQSLPSDGKLLLDAENNAAGKKRAVRVLKNGRHLVDAVNPYWRSGTPAADIIEIYYDEEDPTRFETMPPATVGTQIIVLYSANPAAIDIPADGTIWSDVSGNLALQDLAEPALVEVILGYSFSKDAQFAAQASRWQSHFASAASLLNVSQQTLMAATSRFNDGQAQPVTAT